MSALAKSQRGKAEAYVAEAEKTLSKSKTAWFSSSKEKKVEDAAELYEQAANAYKVGGLNHEAGDCYKRAAELHRDKLTNPNEASKDFSNAASAYKKSSPADAISAYRSAIVLLTDMGRITNAAKLSKECGELYENEGIEGDGDDAGKSSVVLAIEMYEQASELFGMEDAKSQSSQCLAKVAELCSAELDPPDLIRACRIYEDLGRRCLDSNLLKYNAKGYFLQSTLCHLANGDAVGASQALDRYDTLDYTFAEAREGKFARQLVECVEGYDPEGFGTACFEFDRISKLDPWKTSMLVKVKRQIDDGEDGGEDGGDVDLT